MLKKKLDIKLDRFNPGIPCIICERYGTDMQILGTDKNGNPVVRHKDCMPGSPAWCEWFERLPKHKQSDIGRILYETRKIH